MTRQECILGMINLVLRLLLQTETEIEEDMSSDRKQLDTHYEIQSNIHKLRLQFFNQLWIVGTLFFMSLPLSTLFSINMIEESN